MLFPDFLYRYRSAQTEYFEMEISKAFRHREVFCSPISEMNDPLDCNPVLENSSFREVTDTIRKYRIPVVSNESLRRFGADKRMTRKIKKTSIIENARISRQTVKFHMARFRSRTLVASFCQDWNSTLMWSHYTQGHTDICIKYKLNTSKFAKITEYPMKINYVDERSTINTVDAICVARESDINHPLPDGLIAKAFAALALEKSSDWNYEKEWRVAVLENEKAGYYRFHPLEAIGIILGVNDSEKTEKIVRQNIPERASVQRLQIDKSSYKIALG